MGAVPVRGPRGLVVGKTEEADTTGELGTPGGRLDSVWASPPPGPHRARAGLGPEEPEHRPSGAGKSRRQGLQLPGAPAPNRGGGGGEARAQAQARPNEPSRLPPRRLLLFRASPRRARPTHLRPLPECRRGRTSGKRVPRGVCTRAHGRKLTSARKRARRASRAEGACAIEEGPRGCGPRRGGGAVVGRRGYTRAVGRHCPAPSPAFLLHPPSGSAPALAPTGSPAPTRAPPPAGPAPLWCGPGRSSGPGGGGARSRERGVFPSAAARL